MQVRLLTLVLLLAASANPQSAPKSIRIQVFASHGEIIPQSKGGGGFQRRFRLEVVPGPGESNHWIKQELKVRGTVFNKAGQPTRAHLDVVEYYRVNAKGRMIQPDIHYSQYPRYCAGDLVIRSKLTFGRLKTKKRGDTIVAQSFILKWAKDATGEFVIMKTRDRLRIIASEKGKRVEFESNENASASHYEYKVTWNACPGAGPRTKASGTLEPGTWWIETPEQTGSTRVANKPRPIEKPKRHR